MAFPKNQTQKTYTIAYNRGSEVFYRENFQKIMESGMKRYIILVLKKTPAFDINAAFYNRCFHKPSENLR